MQQDNLLAQSPAVETVLQTKSSLEKTAVELQKSHLVETLLQQGLLQMQQQHWGQALNCYQQAIELAPGNAQAKWQLGMVLEKLGDQAAAIDSYFQALSLDPTLVSTSALCRFGEVLKQNHQIDRALSCYQWALQQQETADIHSRIAEIFSDRTEYELAAASYRRAIELEPTWQNYHNLGYVLSKLEQWEAAAQAYTQASQLNPEFPWSHNNLGDMLLRLQQVDAAVQAYERAISLEPDFHWAYCNLGELYANQGELDKAASYHRQAMRMRGWDYVEDRGYCFTHDWFTHNLPYWREHLSPLMGKAVNVLEIGSYEGMATCWLLDYILIHQTAKITCIDLKFQENFKDNIQRTGKSGRVTQMSGDSHQILPTLSPESFDLVYVDGCHLADHAREDACLSWKLLKTGGLMIIDDYEWSDPNCPGQDPKLGVDVFLTAVQPQIEVLHQGYQLILKKILEK